MRISRQRDPGHPQYTMLDEQLEEVTTTQYLGVHLQNNLKWDHQTHYAAGKATQVLNFLMRNFSNCTMTVKEKLYKALVRPHLQYASAAWNPGTKKNKDTLEGVQRRAARFVKSDFLKTSSVTTMMEELGWETLEQMRIKTRVSTLHKIMYGQFDIDINKYTKPKPSRARRSHDRQLILYENATAEPLRQSFFAEATAIWNALPSTLATVETPAAFKSGLASSNI